MSHQLPELYSPFILGRSKQPVNFEIIEDAVVVEAYNPVCGDRYTIYIKLVGEHIERISFHGYGCAVSKASISVLTEQLSPAIDS